ncbi:hypothetical protein [Nitrospirillum amazonense]|uniref:hypothetical protein n=1 Tax=Nitrospirillum amazonense TaxID=28077 RepID=UPI0024122F6C|nr:hypothetical protein [Nitrospirillum amazonense]MDG3444676.1 hypothetical protein [Nitrospirillum amazonense]
MPATLALGCLLVQLRSKRALTTTDRARFRRDLVAAMGGANRPVDRQAAENALQSLLAEMAGMGFTNAEIIDLVNAGALDRSGPMGVRHG